MSADAHSRDADRRAALAGPKCRFTSPGLLCLPHVIPWCVAWPGNLRIASAAGSASERSVDATPGDCPIVMFHTVADGSQGTSERYMTFSRGLDFDSMVQAVAARVGAQPLPVQLDERLTAAEGQQLEREDAAQWLQASDRSSATSAAPSGGMPKSHMSTWLADRPRSMPAATGVMTIAATCSFWSSEAYLGGGAHGLIHAKTAVMTGSKLPQRNTFTADCSLVCK